MWNKPWSFAEGFLIGSGLIAAGLMLELSVGPVVWDAFAWPVNGIVLVGFLLMIAAAYVLRRRVYAFRFIMSFHAAIPALAYAVVLTIVMGLTRQTVNGQWLNNMLTFWPFVLIYVYMAVILGLVVLKRGRRLASFTSTCFHLGLFIAMVTATLGNADMQRLKMITAKGEPEWRALDQQHAFRGALGKGSLGALLVMGSERDLGGHHLVCLSHLFALLPVAASSHLLGLMAAYRLFHTSANVLVGHQLSAVGAGKQCVYLFHIKAKPGQCLYCDM